MNELRLDHVKIGWRVKHFRPRKNGDYLHGTVVANDYKGWCSVKWDRGSGASLVMIECLIASERKRPQPEGDARPNVSNPVHPPAAPAA